MAMERTVFALFDDALTSVRVAAALEQQGFDRDRISLLVPDPRGRFAGSTSGRSPSPPDTERGGRGAAGSTHSFSSVLLPELNTSAAAGPLTGVLTGRDHTAGGLIQILTKFGFSDAGGCPELR
jgi:hypothetical protein